jgi:hypothetical protein
MAARTAIADIPMIFFKKPPVSPPLSGLSCLACFANAMPSGEVPQKKQGNNGKNKLRVRREPRGVWGHRPTYY